MSLKPVSTGWSPAAAANLAKAEAAIAKAERIAGVPPSVPKKSGANPALIHPVDVGIMKTEALIERVEDFDRFGSKSDFSILRLAYAMGQKDPSVAKREYDVMHATTAKSIGWAAGSAGGYFVAQGELPKYFQQAYTSNSVCLQAGVQREVVDRAPIYLPRSSAHGTTYYVAQNSTITESSCTPAAVECTPHWVAGRVTISNIMMKAAPALCEKYLSLELGERIGLGVDKMILVGPGTSNKPTGWKSTASIKTVAIGTNGGTLTPAHVYSMCYALEQNGVPPSGQAFFFHPRTWNTFRQTLVGGDTNNFLMFACTDPTVPGASASLLGRPVFLSTQLPITGTKGSGTNLATVILAHAPSTVCVEFLGLSFEINTQGGDEWASNSAGFRAVLAFDIGVLDPNSVCVLSDTTS